MKATFQTVSCGVLAAGLCLALASNAEAAFLTDFQGNSIFVDEDISDGHVSFAVYETEDSDWTDDFSGDGFEDTDVVEGSGLGASSAAVDTDAEYVYFYQVTNTNPLGGTAPLGEAAINDFFLRNVSSTTISSFGWVTDFVFNEETDDPVGPTSNTTLGPEADGTPATETGDFLDDGPFVKDTAAINPDSAGFQAINFGSGLESTMDWRFSSNMTEDLYSAILWVTSDLAPIFRTSSIRDGNEISSEVVPTPVPTPAGFVLLLTGIPGVAFAWRRRKQLGLSS